MEIEFKATKVFKDIWIAVKSLLYKLIVEEGSSRSSKTWSNFQVIFLHLYENPLKTCTILRDTQKSCREIVEVDFVKWLSDPQGRKKQLEDGEITTLEFDKFIQAESLLKYFVRNKTNHTWTFKHNSSFIRFTGLDDEDDAMGMTQDVCWINEPYNFSHEVYRQLSQRTSDFILFDWNPKKNHWVDDEKKKDNTITLKSTFKDNPFCPLESKRQLLSYQGIKFSEVVTLGLIDEHSAKVYDFEANTLDFTNRQAKELQRCIYNENTKSASDYHWMVYGLGLKSEKPNRIYKGWKTITDQQWTDLPYSEYSYIDFGSSNPTASGSIKFDGIDSFFIKERLHKPSSEMTGSISETLTSLGYNPKIPLVCDSADPMGIQELMINGFNAIPAMKGQGSVNSGIKLVQKFNIYYTESSLNVEAEYDEYEWEIVNNTNLDRPLKKNDHQLDGIRYLITYLCFLLHIKK